MNANLHFLWTLRKRLKQTSPCCCLEGLRVCPCGLEGWALQQVTTRTLEIAPSRHRSLISGQRWLLMFTVTLPSMMWRTAMTMTVFEIEEEDNYEEGDGDGHDDGESNSS